MKRKVGIWGSLRGLWRQVTFLLKEIRKPSLAGSFKMMHPDPCGHASRSGWLDFSSIAKVVRWVGFHQITAYVTGWGAMAPPHPIQEIVFRFVRLCVRVSRRVGSRSVYVRSVFQWNLVAAPWVSLSPFRCRSCSVSSCAVFDGLVIRLRTRKPNWVLIEF